MGLEMALFSMIDCIKTLLLKYFMICCITWTCIQKSDYNRDSEINQYSSMTL